MYVQDINNIAISNTNGEHQKFMSCIFKHKRMLWSCNLELLNMKDAEHWLNMQNDDKHKNYTVLIPHNCKYSPLFIKKIIAYHKLKQVFKKDYVWERLSL